MEHLEYGRWTCQFDDAEVQDPFSQTNGRAPPTPFPESGPPETAAKLIQTLPRLDHNTTVLPHVVEFAISNNNWPKTFRTVRRPERGKPRDGNSPKRTANMGSHSKNQKPDKKRSDPLSRLTTRRRLREIANRKRQESHNNRKEHPLLDQDIVHHAQGYLNTATSRKPPPEPNYHNTTDDERGRIVLGTITLDSSSDEDPETSEELSNAESNPHDCQNPCCTEHGAGDSDGTEGGTDHNGETDDEDADAIARYIYSNDNHKADPVSDQESDPPCRISSYIPPCRGDSDSDDSEKRRRNCPVCYNRVRCYCTRDSDSDPPMDGQWPAGAAATMNEA